MEHQGQKVYAVMAKSVECSEIPEKSGIIRVDDYKQSCVLTTDGKVGSKGNPPHNTHPFMIIQCKCRGCHDNRLQRLNYTHTHYTLHPSYSVNIDIVKTTGYKDNTRFS